MTDLKNMIDAKILRSTHHDRWRVCRLCMSGTRLSHLFISDGTLYFKLKACSLISVQDGDGFPPFICESCEVKLCLFYDFKKQCEATDIRLKEELMIGIHSAGTFRTKQERCSGDSKASTLLSEIDELNSESENKEQAVKTFLKRKTSIHKKNVKKLNSNLKIDLKPKFNKEIYIKSIVNKNETNPLDISDIKENSKNERLCQTSKDILKNDPNFSKKFQCELCGDVFKWKSVLNKHLITHSPEKAKFGCFVCPKRFTRKEYVNVHMRIHAGVRPFMCEVCARPFVKSQDLIRHKIIHSNEKNFSCPECNKKFKRSADVHAHMRTHTGVLSYFCKHCSKGYKSRTGMLKHYNKNQCNIR